MVTRKLAILALALVACARAPHPAGASSATQEATATVAAPCPRDTLVEIGTSLMPDSVAVRIITPTGATTADAYPTVYLLHGYSGDQDDWSRKIQPRLGEYADKYGMVLVMPDGGDYWYIDSPVRADVKMESFITDELVPYIDATCPTIPERGERAITGLSMGGHGALRIAMRHPELFGAAGSMSGAVDLSALVGRFKTSGVLGDPVADKKRWAEYSVMTQARELAPGTLSIILDCGESDPFAKMNAALHQLLTERGVDHAYTSRPGTHNNEYWAESIPSHLEFFNSYFHSRK